MESGVVVLRLLSDTLGSWAEESSSLTQSRLKSPRIKSDER